ncbi:hypothetical protein BABINDRAFT_172585 [Babjeviella inositovora NRRL Y-12698]|uniref:TRUD domain-containing protein n=1 Tax=Babjeviella inositovora NRRL Y-12698 TaxID=984486 RepID=A0A1E3QJC5_9ASCO|nr:uncharacterized protein BABINDRAFT_172585 [Babjeviella inositovora NRRL Y-12698]ODQ77795.1 hypothetical protein BABINDRAFT_172585 [Babjeviella inositovora NRRL Y-12698]
MSEAEQNLNASVEVEGQVQSPVAEEAHQEEPPTKKIKLDVSEEPVYEKDHKQEYTDVKSKGIQECDVGITQYISDISHGFNGILKQRYTDFLVNEIDTDNNVVHLADEGPVSSKDKRRKEREQEREANIEMETPAITEADIPAKFELTEENRTALLECFTAEELSQIEELLTTGNNMETTSTFPDKQSRTKVHQLLRSAFNGRFESITTPENTFRIALVTQNAAFKRRDRERDSNKNEQGVPNYGLGPSKEFVHFQVYKENRETMQVASLLAKFLRIPPKSVRYAGTKDRRGCTVQRCCISRIKLDRVVGLNKGLKGIRLGGFSFSDEGLKLGDLNGNEFLITIRDAESTDPTKTLEEVVSSCFESLKEHGFINYFGMQRFGTFSVSTHAVGVKVLSNDWKGACELILSEQELVAPDSVEARHIWAQTHNPNKTLPRMPRYCTAENSILKQLQREKASPGALNEFTDNQYFNAIMQIPRNLRIMYGHAYQSYVWNSVASKRIELFGLNIVPGDLIIKDRAEMAEVTMEDDEDNFEEDVKKETIVRARPVTQEEVDSGKYSIYDVVLPTPGFDIVYPENQQLRDVYVEVMKKDNLDPFNMARRVREFSLTGSYRTVMGKPTNLEYHIIKYHNPFEQLVNTDLDVLRSPEENKEAVPRILPGEVNGDRTAVVLKMQLGVSAYATMALRELMKTETSRRSDAFDVKEQ